MGLLTRDDGAIQQTDQDAPQFEAAGYVRCYTNDWKTVKGDRGQRVSIPCPFWISPEGQEIVKNQMGGYYTCPVCQRSYNLLSELPWHGVDPAEAEANQREDQQAQNWTAGGGTRIGLTMAEQAQIGEDLVHSLGEIDGDPITWWHNGGASSNSPLDGATRDWGIEVKTIGYDATHHRFVPGGVRKDRQGNVLRDEKQEKNDQAKTLGKKGVKGVLVLLDYRRSVADIYVKDMPLAPWKNATGRNIEGVAAFRSSSAYHLVKEIPFKNPLMDPHSPAPHVEPGTSPFEEPEPDMPF